MISKTKVFKVFELIPSQNFFWGVDQSIIENSKVIGSFQSKWLSTKLALKGKEFRISLGVTLKSIEGKTLVKPREQSTSLIVPYVRQLFEVVEAKQFYLFKENCLFRSPENYDPDDNVPPVCTFDLGQRRAFTIELFEDIPPQIALFIGFYLSQGGIIE